MFLGILTSGKMLLPELAVDLLPIVNVSMLGTLQLTWWLSNS